VAGVAENEKWHDPEAVPLRRSGTYG